MPFASDHPHSDAAIHAWFVSWRAAANQRQREDSFVGFCHAAWPLCAASIGRSGVLALFTEAEVLQEYRLIAWRTLRRFDPSYSVPLPAFLLFCWRQRLQLMVAREKARQSLYLWCVPSEMTYISDART